MFLQYMETEYGRYVPPTWCPLAESSLDGKRTVWAFSRCPGAVLRVVDASLIDNYANFRQEQGDSVNTVIGRVAAVRTLLSVAMRDRVLTNDQAQMLGVQPYKTKRQRDEDIAGRRLSPPEVRAFRATFDLNTKMGMRDLAIADTMLFAGLRRSEVASLRFNNLIRDSGQWWIRIQGKRKKTRRLKVHNVLYASLDRWFGAVGLRWRESDGASTPLFYAFDKGDRPTVNPIDTNVIDRVVSGSGAKAMVIDESGLVVSLAPATGEDRLSSHDLRRTFARNAYDNGATLLQVQIALGHDDPKTTIRYIGLDVADDNTAVDHLRY